MIALTEAQLAALQWLKDHNGEGSVQRGRRILAAGTIAPVRMATWRALEGADMVTIGEGRIVVTQRGLAMPWHEPSADYDAEEER